MVCIYNIDLYIYLSLYLSIYSHSTFFINGSSSLQYVCVIIWQWDYKHIFRDSLYQCNLAPVHKEYNVMVSAKDINARRRQVGYSLLVVCFTRLILPYCVTLSMCHVTVMMRVFWTIESHDNTVIVSLPLSFFRTRSHGGRGSALPRALLQEWWVLNWFTCMQNWPFLHSDRHAHEPKR